MGVLSKKPAKQSSEKMRVMRVDFSDNKPASKAKAGKKDKAMSFAEWVSSYVQMSKGNPV